MASIYVASSWRNQFQPKIVQDLRERGHYVYDFRHPAPGEKGFAWSDIDPEWKSWTPTQFRKGLAHPVAVHGYLRDRSALEWCNASLLVLPSGLSAHGEAFWAAGRGKPTAIYAPEIKEPELMYKLVEDSSKYLLHDTQWFCTTMEEVFTFFDNLNKTWGLPVFSQSHLAGCNKRVAHTLPCDCGVEVTS